MYRVSKILNNNGVIAINTEDNQEYVLLGKGIGFGKKVSQRFEVKEDTATYRLTEQTDRGSAKSLVQEMDPEFLEIADEVIREAEKVFGKVDRRIMIPLADHISFAVSRIRNQEQISNPLTDDIRIMFYKEYKVAGCIRDLLKEKLGIRIDEHEIGYIALHVHAAIVDENVSQAMEIARTVRECICMVEEETGKSIDVMSLSYNRLMNHVRYMVARAIHGEKLKMSLNDYMSVKFPGPYMTAEKICRKMEKSLKLPIPDIEIGYLAMHLERMMDREEE